MKDIPCTPGARRVRAWVAEGEHENQDFKLTIPEPAKIARSISAFANHSGGRLLIGVKDNGVIAGVRSEEDVYVIEYAAERFCVPPQTVEFHAYSIDTGVTVIVASIPAAPERPVEVREPDGTLRAYFRVADENIAAHPLMVEGWRRRARATASAITIGADQSRILEYLRESPSAPVSEDRIALALHLSRRRVDDLLADLAALGLISFEFDGKMFGIRI